MKADFKNALMLRLEPLIPAHTGPWLFLNAQPLPGVGKPFKQQLLCIQESRSDFLRLEAQGYQASPEVGDETGFSGAIILVDRNRRINERNISLANSLCGPDAPILISGDKKSGITALRKWTGERFGDVSSFSKYHAVVLELKAKSSSFNAPDLTRPADGFTTAEGMFSAGEVDPGSKLLAACFDERIKGAVADLGAGWGYLSVQLAKATNNLQRLDLFENHFSSTQAAITNLKQFHGANETFCVHWRDVLNEPPSPDYDWVIMNPPFHSSRAAEPAIGLGFIETAHKCLKQGGYLLMVANLKLPYETKLAERFRSVEKRFERDGYKVFEARR